MLKTYHQSHINEGVDPNKLLFSVNSNVTNVSKKVTTKEIKFLRHVATFQNINILLNL